MSTAINRLQIRRFRADYLVAADHPSPETLKARLDETIERRLASALSVAFAPWFSESDTSLWFIRRLQVDVALNAALERDQIAEAFTAQIGKSLGDALQERADDGNVLRFPNRAAYLAAFLSDLANGAAWSKWYYESFAGLKPLPISSALRTAICDDASTGGEALQALSPLELRRVISSLTSADARRILDSLAESDAGADEFRSFEAVWAAWSAAESISTMPETWQQALHAYVSASHDFIDAGGSNLRKAAVALSRLYTRLALGSEDDNDRLVMALLEGDQAALYDVAGAADYEALLALLTCPADWRREVGLALLGKRGPRQAVEQASARRGTPFGGAFLLLPFLDDLPLAECVRGWPNTDQAAAVSLVRFLILIKCAGQERGGEAFRDPLLRDLLLIPPDVSRAVLREWQEGITEAQLAEFLEALIEWQTFRGAMTSETQVLATLCEGDNAVAVLVDGRRGLWLAVRQYEPRKPEDLSDFMRSHLTRLSGNAGLLLCDPSLQPSIQREFEGLRIASIDGSQDMVRQLDAGDATKDLVARLDKIAGDVNHLALPAAYGIDRALDATLTIAAQHVMRSFAYRLSGFAASNLPYIWHNFLDSRATFEEDAERRIIRLGRPPLHLIFSMTAMMRQTFRVGWLDGRPFDLFQEE
jgi:hypothetical protein